MLSGSYKVKLAVKPEGFAPIFYTVTTLFERGKIMYWSIEKSISYGCLFNFIVGARGVGKTYGAKEKVIKRFLKDGSQFVYVRRYKEELKKVGKFFDDIKKEFSEHSFEVKGKTFLIDNEVAGTAIALSTAKIEKSTPYPNVTFIIFDEFILDRGFHRYLPDEVTNFLELYSTVARSRDVIVYFLSNALTMTNPYFLYFDITTPYKKSIKAQDDILVELVENPEYSDMMKHTRFGKLISNTAYADYSMDNKFLRDDNTFIEKKNENAKHYFSMYYKGEKYHVWLDYKNGLSWVSNDFDPSCDLCYSITMDDHKPNTFLLKGAKPHLVDIFIKAYKLGCVRFESINIKNICREIIKLTL